MDIREILFGGPSDLPEKDHTLISDRSLTRDSQAYPSRGFLLSGVSPRLSEELMKRMPGYRDPYFGDRASLPNEDYTLYGRRDLQPVGQARSQGLGFQPAGAMRVNAMTRAMGPMPETPRGPMPEVAAPAPAEAPLPPPRPRSIDTAMRVARAVAPAPAPQRVAEARGPSAADLWAIYNETGNAADFIRADRAMREGRAAGGEIDGMRGMEPMPIPMPAPEQPKSPAGGSGGRDAAINKALEIIHHLIIRGA